MVFHLKIKIAPRISNGEKEMVMVKPEIRSGLTSLKPSGNQPNLVGFY
jgi:hypothetical protein